MSIRAALAAIAFILSATPGLAAEQGSAAAYIEDLYAREWPGDGARFSPRLEQEREACEAKADAEDDICMDFDFFVQGQDHLITDLVVEPLSDDGKTAKVKVAFKNFDRPTTLVFDLVRDDEGWMIEEIASDCETLTDALKHLPPKC